MDRPRSPFRGFTLIELMLVMVIIVVVTSLVAPSFLHGFGKARACQDTARQVVGMATFARSNAMTQGRVFRLYVDGTTGTYWLAEQSAGGTFAAPMDDSGNTVSDLSAKRYIDSGLAIDLTVKPQANTVALLLPPNVKQQNSKGDAELDLPSVTPNQWMWNVHDAGTPYVEFQPNGRTDTAQVKVTDKAGHSATAACDSATEIFHLVLPGNGGAS